MHHVEITALSAECQVVAHIALPIEQWYEELQALIDTNEERARLGVTVIDGRELADNGVVRKRWHAQYDAHGSLVGGWEQRAGGRVRVSVLGADGQLTDHEVSEPPE